MGLIHGDKRGKRKKGERHFSLSLCLLGFIFHHIPEYQERLIPPLLLRPLITPLITSSFHFVSHHPPTFSLASSIDGDGFKFAQSLLL